MTGAVVMAVAWGVSRWRGDVVNEETSVTVLQRPAPLRYAPVIRRGEASIPDGVPFAFVCELGGELLSNDWKIIGVVKQHDRKSGILTFQQDEFAVGKDVREKSEEGHLAYRLPHGLSLPLEANDPITIVHDHETNLKRMEWDIHIASGDELIFALSHQHDDTPPRSADKAEVLFDGALSGQTFGGHAIFFWSDPSNNDVDQKLSGQAIIQSPVSIRTDANGKAATIESDGDRTTLIQLGTSDYHFVVLSSEHFSHDHATGEASEDPPSGSHSLECFLLKADQPDRQ